MSNQVAQRRSPSRGLVFGLSIGALLVLIAWTVFVLPVMSIFTPDRDRTTEVLLVSVGPLTLAGGLWLAAGTIIALGLPPRPWIRPQYVRSGLALLLGLVGLATLAYAIMWGRALSCAC